MHFRLECDLMVDQQVYPFGFIIVGLGALRVFAVVPACLAARSLIGLFYFFAVVLLLHKLADTGRSPLRFYIAPD